jgi:uncharacterized protein (TIGR03435 family)
VRVRSDGIESEEANPDDFDGARSGWAQSREETGPRSRRDSRSGGSDYRWHNERAPYPRPIRTWSYGEIRSGLDQTLRGGGRSDTNMGPAGGFPTVSPGRLNTTCAALAAAYPTAGLIQRAYGRLRLGHLTLGSALPVSGGPSWIYSDHYTIKAKAADLASEKTMEGPMLQALLEDRFKLKVHRETRTVPVYTLTVAKGGPRLQPADQSCIPPSTYPSPPLAPGKRYCLDVVGGRNGPNTTLKADASTLDYVCKLLGLMLDRPVIDKTGLPGKYRVYLEFAVDQSTPGALEFTAPPSDELPAPSIFTVVQQQLGLKLEPTKGPREYIVIDHVERPSEN